MHLLMILLAGVFFVCRVYAKMLHFTLCLLIIPQNINGHRRGLQGTNADNGGDLLVYSLCH